MCKFLRSNSWEAKQISLWSPFLPDALFILGSSATSILKCTKRTSYWTVEICLFKSVYLFLTLFSHSNFIDLAESAHCFCITTPNGGGDLLVCPTSHISDVNVLWKFRHLNARRQKHTFVRRLFSSCGWSLTTSPSCWAAAFRVTGVVPVSSRINSRSSLKTENKTTDKINEKPLKSITSLTVWDPHLGRNLLLVISSQGLHLAKSMINT